MKALVVTMPDGSEWAVPVEVIARRRAEYYADEYDGDVQRSLDEDTLPLFESSPSEVADWAANEMNWEDEEVSAVAFELSPAPPVDFHEGWINGEKRVEDVAEIIAATARRLP